MGGRKSKWNVDVEIRKMSWKPEGGSRKVGSSKKGRGKEGSRKM
jgi:hypothetical protein